jgi:hypothetical protein
MGDTRRGTGNIVCNVDCKIREKTLMNGANDGKPKIKAPSFTGYIKTMIPVFFGYLAQQRFKIIPQGWQFIILSAVVLIFLCIVWLVFKSWRFANSIWPEVLFIITAVLLGAVAAV